MGQKLTTKRVKGKTIFKHETEADWGQSNYIPEQGEKILYDPDESHNYTRVKYGDGSHTVKDLPFSPSDKIPQFSITTRDKVLTINEQGEAEWKEPNSGSAPNLTIETQISDMPTGELTVTDSLKIKGVQGVTASVVDDEVWLGINTDSLPDGLKGEKGDPGEQGPQGEKGEKGDKGDNGTEILTFSSVEEMNAFDAPDGAIALVPKDETITPVLSVNGVVPDENGNVEVKSDPYTLTEEDKASIVTEVLSAMPVAEELSV